MSEVNKESKEEISYEPDPLLEAMRSVVGHDEELLAEWSDTGYFTRAMMAMKEYASIRTAELKEENERLRGECEEMKGLIDRSNSVLRSAASISERKGAYTNWEGFLKQVEAVLKDQRTLFYPKYTNP